MLYSKDMENNSSELIKQIFDLKTENKKLRKENEELRKANSKLSLENKKIKVLEDKCKNLEDNIETMIADKVQKAINMTTQNLTEHYESIIRKLNNKISKLEKTLNTDSSNSSLPSSKNRIGKKVIPNTREKSNNSIGGQIGHKVHKLDYFKDDEITETIEHTLDKCPNCNGELIEINTVKSDIIDFEIKIKKIRNNIHNYKCKNCHKSISANNELPRGASYGNNVNALALSLLNDSNVSYNKVVKHICGISNGEINLTEGYLVKLQKKSADKLNNFIQDLKRKILTLDKVHWDDTVVKIQSETENRNGKKIKEGYIRFYGDDSFALLIGHKKKDKESITEDGILPYLSENCTCIHDHVLLNYNEEYKFKNAECNSHILRYLKGVKDNLHDHIWQDKMSDLLKEMNNKRDEYISTKVKSFTNEEIESYYKKYEEIINLGYEENSKTKEYHFYKEDEKNLIERLDKYKDNHLLFIKDFTVPFTNNTAERGLRQTKRKLAVSFLFKNTSTMEDYAKIISYLETSYRNGITKFEALRRLVSNNPYTVEEIGMV